MLNKLVFTDTAQGVSGIVDNSHIYGGISYDQSSNNTVDIDFGATACSTIKFVSDVLNSSTIDKECDYYIKQSSDSDWRLIGHYTVKQAEKTGNKWTITAYDNIVKFDVIVDDWLNTTLPAEYPNGYTLAQMFTSLVKYCFGGTTGHSVTSDFPANANRTIEEGFVSTNLDGRAILAYIAQAAGGFAMALANGKITIQGYKSTIKSLNNSNYVSYEYADYTAPAINKVQIAADEETTPATAGSGDTCLRIIANPLLIADTLAELTQFATDILQHCAYTYVPMKIELLEDYSINVGDIITVNNVSTLVMSKSFNASGVTLQSTGNKTRDVKSSDIASQINALRGSYSKIKIDLNEVSAEVGRHTGEFAKITLTADAIESLVSGNSTYVESATQPSSPTTGMVWKNTTTGLYYQYDGLYWNEVEASVKGAAVTNKVTQTLDGVVYDNGFGTTIINGAHIDTGTITASDAIINGTITFGKLDSNTQSKINSSGEIYRSVNIPSTTTTGALWYCMRSQGTYEMGTWYTYNGSTWVKADIPDYLHNTYIDETQIYSPEIIGSTIYAGAQSDGYVMMNDTGIELHTDSAEGALVDIGYTTGYYDIPYILMGRGSTGGVNRGMVKKYSTGIWIGDDDNVSNVAPGGDGLFVNFNDHKVYVYYNNGANSFEIKQYPTAVFG